MTTSTLSGKTEVPVPTSGVSTAARRGWRWSAQTFGYGLLVLYAVVSLYPFALMVSGAFKDNKEIQLDGHLVPYHPTFSTLVHTWNELHFLRYFGNSVQVTGFTTIGVIVVYSLAAYAFGVLRFPGRRLIYGMFLALLFVPGVTVLLPIVILQSKLGILGTHLGLILPFVNGTAPLSILLLTNAVRSVPKELRESARCDGASELRTFWSIYLPSCRPALVTIAMLTAIPTWNEYALTRVSLDNAASYTLPVALQDLNSTVAPQQNVLMAASLIIVVPVIILFVLLQRYFVNGLQGAVKG